jgi:hypothetical protein
MFKVEMSNKAYDPPKNSAGQSHARSTEKEKESKNKKVNNRGVAYNEVVLIANRH